MTDEGLSLGLSPEQVEEWGSVERFEPGESNRTVTALASVAALGGFLFGYDSAVINGAVKAIGDHFHTAAGTLGFAVASALLGAAVGAVAAGRVADWFGRLWAMRLAALLFLVSAVGTALAGSLALLIVFRVIGGVGVGIASVIAPAYIAEIAPARIRGRLGSLQQLAIVLGIFVALLIDYVLATAAGGSEKNLALGLPAWRWMFLAMLVPAIVYGIGAFFIPESPRYLVVKDRLGEAGEVLRRVLGNIDIPGKVREIQQTLAREVKPTMRDLRGPALGLLPIVWVGIGLAAFQQFVGINVIFYYSSVLWQAVGFSESDSLIITVITSVVNIVTTLVAISRIDQAGRKPLLIIGSIGMTVTLGAMALVFGLAPLNSKGEPVLHGAAGPIALIAANLFVFSFGMSWGPVVWVMLGEMFPNRIRAAALSVGAAANWVANWIVSTSFPSLKNAGLGLAYGIYAACALLSLFFVLKFTHETKGVELEEMTEDVGLARSA
ncbi:MAG: sugar porter family MFS transporter [Solirubrobacterales bacterium]|nr:sugar porter family MFS transporter [Solirubrobacterales bacterium]MBV9941565.1 sugar porter family MFS transporter [Solirubrobacterales bacterium]